MWQAWYGEAWPCEAGLGKAGERHDHRRDQEIGQTHIDAIGHCADSWLSSLLDQRTGKG